MPQVPINYLTVVAAATASTVIGMAWYGFLFNKQWVALMGWTPQEIEAAKAKAAARRSYLVAAVGSLVMAYVLAHSLIFASAYFNASGFSAGLTAGFWNWLGFVAPVTLGAVLWEGRPWKLWILNNGYWLVSLLAMGVILALWQ